MNRNNHELENQLCIISVPTLKKLLSYKNNADLIALYTFYYVSAKIQKTNLPKALPSFCRKGLHWGKERFEKADKILKNEGLIENYARRNEKGKITGWYIKIKYLWTTDKTKHLTHPEAPETRHLTKPPSGLQPTNALSVKNNINALSVKETKCFSSASQVSSDSEKPKPIIHRAIDIVLKHKPDWMSDARIKELKHELTELKLKLETKPAIYIDPETEQKIKTFSWELRDRSKLANQTRGVLKHIWEIVFHKENESLFLEFITKELTTGRPPDEPNWLINHAWMFIRERQTNQLDTNLSRKEEERFLEKRDGGLQPLEIKVVVGGNNGQP